MNLTTNLDRDRYHWVTDDPATADHATLTIVVATDSLPDTAIVRMQVGSAMRSVQIKGGPSGGGGAILDVGLDGHESGKAQRISARVTPGRMTRPGRRRVAVVQVVADGEILASTTVWARVERQPPSARNTSGPPTRRM